MKLEAGFLRRSRWIQRRCWWSQALLAVVFALCLLHSSSAQQAVAPPSGKNPPGPSRIDPKARELLDRVIRALGGPAFLHFRSLTTTGRIYAISDEATAGLEPFKMEVTYPDKRRFTYGKKKPVILINNGDRDWELDKYGMTHQLPEQIRRWKLSTRYSLENLLRLQVREPGILIQDAGVDFVDNVPTRVVEIIGVEGAQAKLYLHQQTFLPVRIDYQDRDPKTHEWDEFADVYGDYHDIQGVQTPMHIARFVNGERFSEIFRRTALYDEDYPADYFEPAS